MSQLPVTPNSEWDYQHIADFLQSSRTPMRLAVNDDSGFPRICSLWFSFDGRDIVAATHESSLITALLKNDNRCAFEIATNDQPYKGVRGQARAQLDLQHGQQVLPELIERYLGRRLPRLRKWLMSRIAGEYGIRLHIEWISAWDYSSRMTVEEK